MSGTNFFEELKRRNVYRVAVTYAVVAWLLLQIVSVVVPMIEAPLWVGKVVLIVLLVGFPIALLLAWAFEMSPQGFIRTTSPEADTNPLPDHKKKPLTSNVIIGVLVLLLIGQWAYNRDWKTDVKRSDLEKSIAVLPFKNESSNQENQFFCNGIMEGVLDHLAKIPELTVVSRTSVEQYRLNPPPIKEIAQALGVEFLVEGSVQRIGDEAIIFAQLIHATDDRRLWSQNYERNLSDIFAIQAEITQSIADGLQAIITPDIIERIEAVPTSDPLAYDYFLQGNEYLFNADAFSQANEAWNETLSKAQLSYELALKRDSAFAEAIIGLANVDYQRNVEASILNDDYLSTVISSTNRALVINPNLSNGYLLRSQAHYKNARVAAAKIDLEKALTLNPNNVQALNHQMEIYRFTDLNFTKAIETGREIEKRTHSKEDLWKLYDTHIGMAWQISDLERALVFAKKKRALIPNRFSSLYFIYKDMNETEKAWQTLNEELPDDNQYKFILAANHLLYIHQFDKAMNYYIKWLGLLNDESEDNWLSINDWHRYGQALMKTGNKAEGVAMLNKQIEINKRKAELNRTTSFSGLAAYYDLAGIYAFLDQKETAYEWLNKFEEQKGWLKLGLLNFVKVDLQFDNLRNDERFQAMIARVEAETLQGKQQVEALMPLSQLRN